MIFGRNHVRGATAVEVVVLLVIVGALILGLFALVNTLFVEQWGEGVEQVAALSDAPANPNEVPVEPDSTQEVATPSPVLGYHPWILLVYGVFAGFLLFTTLAPAEGERARASG